MHFNAVMQYYMYIIDLFIITLPHQIQDVFLCTKLLLAVECTIGRTELEKNASDTLCSICSNPKRTDDATACLSEILTCPFDRLKVVICNTMCEK